MLEDIGPYLIRDNAFTDLAAVEHKLSVLEETESNISSVLKGKIGPVYHIAGVHHVRPVEVRSRFLRNEDIIVVLATTAKL